MRENWHQIERMAIASEGGYTADPRDPGNWTGGKINAGRLLGTKYGIAANTYGHLDIKNLTREQAVAIYKRDYWDKISGDSLPAGLDYSVFDFALNSGVRRAVIELQKLVGVPADGVMGGKTLDAVKRTDAKQLIGHYNARRLEFMRGLKNWPVHGKGWTDRVNKVRSASIRMAEGAIPDAQSSAQPIPKARDEQTSVTTAITSDNESRAQAGTGVGVGGSALVEVSQSITETSEKLEPLTHYLEIAKYLFLILAVAGFAISVYMLVKRKRQQL